MTPTSESGLVAAIVRAIRKEHPKAWVFKTVGSPYQMAGVPDLLVCVGGRLFGFEVKFRRPGESENYALSRASPQQRYQIRAINGSGAVARVVTSPEAVMATIAKGLARGSRKDGARDHGD